MKSKKWIASILCAVLAGLCLTGCMNAGARMTPNVGTSALPSATATTAPGNSGVGSVMPDVSDLPAAFNWLTGGASVEEKLGMLSEVASARIIANGATALVGVTFDEQYRGEMTSRIHDMIAGEIQSADPSIKTVAVTAHEEDVRRINELADQIASGTPVGNLEDEIDSIIRSATTIQ